MFNSLFPHGFILVAILAFFLFMIGVVTGERIGSTYEQWANARVKQRVLISAILRSILVGLFFSLLYYHFVMDMIFG